MQHDENSHIPVQARSAGVVILDSDDRILLVREKIAHKTDLWHIPAGSVEEGEPLEAAAIRETKEETGLEVKLICYLNTYLGHFPSGDLVMRHVWLARQVDERLPEPLLPDEIAECRYFSKLEFDGLYQARKIRMYHTKLIFEEALLLKKYPSGYQNL
ncbi:MAG: NUDIX domain-containing protein [Trueperaceae bacterium]|nr:NUDIX domain-containing protein [Trueperaceae bacterium]